MTFHFDYKNIRTNASTASQVPLTLEEHVKIADDFKTKERELLRGASLMIEEMECPKCGRKPTVTGRGLGDKTYIVCPHIWESIKANCVQADPNGMSPNGSAPLGFLPYGLRIEVLDDGPRRW